MKLTRRSFSSLLGGAAATVLRLPGAAAAIRRTEAKSVADRQFPSGFLWGSATASYQVEGAVREDGRSDSIWDVFSHIPGNTHDGDTGDVADDFYYLFRNDISLMRDLGLKTFRFSISWSRVIPGGRGTVNAHGLDFYNRLVDALMESGIQPFCTLYHWDLPQVLQDQGGWKSRETVRAFADYAGLVSARLSDRVKHFMTMNEMRTFVELGYQEAKHAPGLKLDTSQISRLTHNVVLAHGLGVQAIRAYASAEAKVGLAENPTATVPVVEDAECIRAARAAFREENAQYLTVILDGKYPDRYLEDLGKDAPKFTDEEMKIIGTPLDFVGCNVYGVTYIGPSDDAKGYSVLPFPSSYPQMHSRWLAFGPEAIYWVPRIVFDLWGVKELYITENGTSSADGPRTNGEIYDLDRVMFLRSYLTQLHRATSENIPVKGYFLWSLLDRSTATGSRQGSGLK
jgi:beta-glucosidase